MTWIGLQISSLLLSAIGAWAASRHAQKIGLVDCPNDRSSHCIPTPKGGGIGIFAAFVLVAFLAELSVLFWLPIAIMSVIAFCGDRIDLSVRLRLILQLGLIAFVVSAGGGRTAPDGLLFIPWVGFWTVFIVGTANYYNFMDGINGIAGIAGILGFAMLALYVDRISGPNAAKVVAGCLSLACLGFLPFNIPNARVFMGDIGSVLLGSVFAGLIWLVARNMQDFICMAAFLFPFYADELTTAAVRLRDRENLILPHRRHYYQLLVNEKGIAHWKVSVGYGVLQLLVGASVLVLKPYGTGTISAVIAAWLGIFWIESLRVRKQTEK